MSVREKGQFGYTRREEALNFYSHLAALAAALAGSAFMMLRAFETSDNAIIAACSIFSLTLIMVFASSSLYHGLPDGKLKYNAKKFDHISIYWIICGIYTALVLAAVQNKLGIIIVAVVWILGIWGTYKKFENCPTGEKANDLPLYIGMSSLVIPIFPFLDAMTIAFLLSAAVLNIVGLYFYRKKGKEFNHFIWHAFSFAASTCDYFAVLYVCELI
jgi:hemolysin III